MLSPAKQIRLRHASSDSAHVRKDEVRNLIVCNLLDEIAKWFISFIAHHVSSDSEVAIFASGIQARVCSFSDYA